MLCSLVLCFSVVGSTKTCFAQGAGVIYIRADGSTDPPTASISTLDNVTYTLTGDILNDSIVIERDNIVLNGAGYTLQGINALNSIGTDVTGTSNITIKNITIKAFYDGICLNYSSGNNISGNNITNCFRSGILFESSSDNSISENNMTANNGYGIFSDNHSGNSSISGNNISNNWYGIGLYYSSGNHIYHNNFINNTNQVLIDSSGNANNSWDDGYPSGGNYWSNYKGIDSNHDGIGDTAYIIDENNTDHYPLMAQYVIPEFPSFLILPLFMVATLLAIIVYKRRHLTRA